MYIYPIIIYFSQHHLGPIRVPWRHSGAQYRGRCGPKRRFSTRGGKGAAKDLGNPRKKTEGL